MRVRSRALLPASPGSLAWEQRPFEDRNATWQERVGGPSGEATARRGICLGCGRPRGPACGRRPGVDTPVGQGLSVTSSVTWKMGPFPASIQEETQMGDHLFSELW